MFGLKLINKLTNEKLEGGTSVAIKQPDLFDAAAMHEKAQKKVVQLVDNQFHILQGRLKRYTERAVGKGRFNDRLAEHESFHPATVVKAIGWLREQGFQADLGNGYRDGHSCSCQSHISWSWENKIQRKTTHDVIHAQLVSY